MERHGITKWDVHLGRPKAPSYMSDRLERKRQNAGGGYGHGVRWSSHTAQIFLTRPSVSSCVRHGCNSLERFPSEWGHLSEQGSEGSVIRGLTILHKSLWLGQGRSMTLQKNKFFRAKRTHSIVEKTNIRFFKRKPKGFDINKTLLFCMHNTQKTVRQKIFTPGISELTNSTKGKSQEWDSKQR
jgi:hypothetical protein